MIEASGADEDDKVAMYELIASYVVSRALCVLTLKIYNNTFVRIASRRQNNGVRFAEATEAFHDLQGETVRFPSDDDLRANPRQSNLSCDRKRPLLCNSHLKTNQEIASDSTCDESAFRRRAARLGDLAVLIWPAPAIVP